VTKRRALPAGPPLSPIEAQKLMELFRQEAGLAFTDEYVTVLERRLRERLLALDMRSFSQYLDHLRSPGGAREMEEALEVVTTHETYFFREEYQLRAFRDEVLPTLRSVLDGRKRLSLWSAGCSTGEEAYTLAMVVAESRLFDGWEVRVFGSDLSRKCIAAARRAVYGKAAFRVVPKEFRNAYFVEEPEGTRPAPAIRALCTFGQINLLYPDRSAVVGRVDAIFCRNVLIYLDTDARRRVIDTLYERLAPGGYLMLGHSESLLNVTSAFEVVHLKEDLVYRKRDFDSSSRFRIDPR
jgi:chemotaxis protein methyltransferase CheR